MEEKVYLIAGVFSREKVR